MPSNSRSKTRPVLLRTHSRNPSFDDRPFHVKCTSDPGIRPVQNHTHRDIEFGVVTKGTVYRLHCGKEYLAHEGDAFIIDGSIAHGNRSYRRQPYDKVFVGLRTDVFFRISPCRDDMRFYLPFLALHAGLNPIVKQAWSVRDRLLEAYSHFTSGDPDSDMQTWPLIVSALVDVYLLKRDELGSTKLQSLDRQIAAIRDAVALLNTRFREPLTLAGLAQSCNLSESRFRKIFTSVYRMPPIEYRNRLRIEHAIDLMLQTNHKLTFIASECGFESYTQFAQLFKKQTGQSPNGYREQAPERYRFV